MSSKTVATFSPKLKSATDCASRKTSSFGESCSPPVSKGSLIIIGYECKTPPPTDLLKIEARMNLLTWLVKYYRPKQAAMTKTYRCLGVAIRIGSGCQAV